MYLYTLILPILETRVSTPLARRPLNRVSLTDPGSEWPVLCDVAVNTDISIADVASMEKELKDKLKQAEGKCEELHNNQHFLVEKICSNDAKVRFHTDTDSFTALIVCFSFLGESVKYLIIGLSRM